MSNRRQPGDSVSVEAGRIDEETFVRDNVGWMLSLAERLLKDRAEAQDVVQEALLKALGGLADFEGRARLETWLRRITVNTAISKLRKRNQLAEQPIDELLPEFDRFDCRVEARWPELASVDEVLASEERRRMVFECVWALPDAYRLVVQLRDIEQYDTAEVAELLDISVSNVKVRLHRARAALKKLLEPLLRQEDSP